MGIARLTQDITIFSEAALLARRSDDTDAIILPRVLIDGPSMVFHICNRIWSHASSADRESAPSYAAINAGVLQFLNDIKSTGTTIINIYFDGGLPPAKRPERLQRLEQNRKQLETFRRVRHRPPNHAARLSDISVSDLIWQPKASSMSRSQPLPHPPFMVASVLESLLQSPWRDVVQLVPGESDPYCAAEALQSNAAILSNDSDLVVYDIGRDGRVVNFATLEFSPLPSGKAVIRARCLRPSSIAQQLGIEDMLHYAYQRSLDSSASSSVIVQRTLSSSMQDSVADDWQAFTVRYTAGTSLLRDESKFLHDLDPRVAELIRCSEKNEGMHVYLPIVIEDHERDSSWSYGLRMRQMAYSILFHPQGRNNLEDRLKNVTEYVRRGSRIAESTIPTWSTTALVRAFEKLTSEELSLDHGRSSRLFRYYAVAAFSVAQEKSSRGKDVSVTLGKIFDHRMRRMPDYDWETIHLLANIQAVLYSMRILQQLARYTITQLKPNTAVLELVHTVVTLLADMPPISQMFLTIGELQQELQSLPVMYVRETIRAILKHVGPAEAKTLSNTNSQAGQASVLTQPQFQPHKEPQVHVHNGRRKRKKTTIPTQEILTSGVASSPTSKKPAISSANAFALLDGCTDSQA